MSWIGDLRRQGIAAALGAALLFGGGTPLAKMLLAGMNPWLLAGLLYLGSGLGLTLYRAIAHLPRAHVHRGEWPWLLGAVFAGGVIGPVLLMFGLSGMQASQVLAETSENCDSNGRFGSEAEA